MKQFIYCIFYCAFLFLLSHLCFSQRIKVVNMIPKTYSGEVYRDAEPNLAVKPDSPRIMVATAFTPEPMVGNLAPVFFSLDGGNEWDLLSVIPGGNAPIPFLDITIRFGGSGTYLYAGALRGDVSDGEIGYPKMNILRIIDFPPNAPIVEIMKEREEVDQPYIQATTVMGGGERTKDKVYVGNNDKYRITHTATMDFLSFKEDGTAETINSDAIEQRVVSPGRKNNLPAIRTAIHSSGVAYAVFYRINVHRENGPDNVDVIVVRDDNWAADADIFKSLHIPGETFPGRKIITERQVEVSWNYALADESGELGNNRLTGSNLSIAVDPNNPAIVYVAWADNHDSKNTLHVRSSVNSGETWSDTDLLTVSNATNPALAVNTNGKIGFLYQQVTGAGSESRWETHLQRSADGGLSWSDDTLSKAEWDNFFCIPDSCPPRETSLIYLGDYLHLMAVGKDFYGVFSASNYPDKENFPDADELIYQREHDFDNKKLYSDENHIPANVVPVSIDPFFFHVTEIDSTKDFYVRDYTNSATDFDEGLEPSVEPRFCRTPDVWNRRSNDAGGFNADDQPLSENPWQHPQRNFAFARVHRKKTGTAATVKLNFLYSDYGAGNNYQNLGDDADVRFDNTETLKISDGYEWVLSGNSSSHVCLGVEIYNDDDPVISPSLEGRVPGWSNGTDLMVINDNNKAQRNMNVYSIVENSDITTSSYAIVHNPGLYEVTAMKLWYKYKFLFDPRINIPGDPPLPFPEQDSVLQKNVAIIGGNNSNYSVTDSSIVLFNMKPGESRFVKISNPFAKGQRGQQVVVDFDQVRNDVIINGFTVVQDYVSLEKAAEENIRYNASAFGRIHAIYPTMDTAIMVKNNDLSTLKTRMDSKSYADYLARNLPLMKSIVKKLTGLEKNDPFELTTAISLLHKQLEEKDSSGMAAAHLSLLNTIDAYLTHLQLQKGNIADILQTMYLQREIFRKINAKVNNEFAGKLVTASEEFISRFEKREWSTNDYPGKVKEMLPDIETCMLNMVTINRDGPINSIKVMNEKLNDARELQGAHIKLLLMLRELTEQ